MGFFDTLVDAAADYIGGDDGDDMIDTFRGFLSGDDDGGDGSSGGGDDGVGRALTSLFGGSDDEGSEDGNGDGGGWTDRLGGLVDRFSGDGGREGLWDRATETLADRFSSYLPEELRGVAGRFLGPDGAGDADPGAGGSRSWAGSLLDAGRAEVPSGWDTVGNHPGVGHRFGEHGAGGLDHGIGSLTDRMADIGSAVAPARHAGDPFGDAAVSGLAAPGHDPAPDPRVSMPADALGRDRYADTDGDGHDDRADYDDLVTSGAPASAPGHDVPDDPTFPTDIEPALPTTVDPPDVPAPPADHFEQAIDEAEQVDTSMGAMFDGLEGTV